MALICSQLGEDVVTCEMKGLKDLRQNSCSEVQFVNWLLNSHIHFITSHPHQGTEKFDWPVTRVYDQLQRLRYHPGFPRLDQLRCPVVTQDKFVYFEDLPSGTMMPTFKIPLSRDLDISKLRLMFTK